MNKRVDQAYLDYAGGMKYKDIAEKYGISINTVKSWKTRYNWKRDSKPAKSSTGAKKGAHKAKKGAHKNVEVAVDELSNNDELTEKQKLFCLYYIQRFNATWAYQKAYGGDYESAHASGPRMLANVSVKGAIGKLRKEQQSDLLINANDILKEYIKQATASLGDVLDYNIRVQTLTDADGNQVFDANKQPITYHSSDVFLKPSSQIDWSTVEELRVGRDGLVVKLYDKQKAMKAVMDRIAGSDSTDKMNEMDKLLNLIDDGSKQDDKAE